MKKIISTVGTSLFTNESEFKEDVKPDYENLLEKSNLEWNNYEKKIDKIKENIKNKLDEDSSAEIKSIVKIIEKLGKDEEYELYFLCSDTCASRMAAEILTDYFNKTTNVNTKANFHPGDDVISKLQIENVEDFKEGMTNLIDRIYQIAGGYFENIVLNITGGYKATIPFMTLYAQVNKIPLYYIFESSSELIEIPYFPVDLDLDIVINEWIAFDLIGKEVKTDNPRPIPIEEFKNSLCNEDSYEDLMMKGLIYEDAGNIRLTPTGRILYGGFKRAQEDEKFNEGNIVGKLIELKIYEYWNNKVRDMSGIVENGKKFGDNGYEADIFVKYNDNEKVICIECKPGKNVPFDKLENNFINGLAPKVKIKFPNSEFYIYLYSPDECLHEKVIEKIQELNGEHTDISLKWYHVSLDKDYKQKPDWKPTENNIKLIDLQPKNEEVKTNV